MCRLHFIRISTCSPVTIADILILCQWSAPTVEVQNSWGDGLGTEHVEDQLDGYFPEARIARMDLDTTRTRNAYERLIDDFSSGKTNLLIGTPGSICKGLDFDKVECGGHTAMPIPCSIIPTSEPTSMPL